MPFTSYTGPAPLEQAHSSWADVYNLIETLTERKPRFRSPLHAARRRASYAVKHVQSVRFQSAISNQQSAISHVCQLAHSFDHRSDHKSLDIICVFHI